MKNSLKKASPTYDQIRQSLAKSRKHLNETNKKIINVYLYKRCHSKRPLMVPYRIGIHPFATKMSTYHSKYLKIMWLFF